MSAISVEEKIPTARKAKFFVVADPDKCVGCGICELACSIEKSGVFNPLKSRIRIVRIKEYVNMSVSCRLCYKAPCVSACPRDALTQDEETGVIIVDADKCNGCGWCIEACDFGAMILDPEEKIPIVCDVCQDRREKGLPPACVEWCPEEALSLVTEGMLTGRIRTAAMYKLALGALVTTKACKRCEDPPCVAVCPRNALRKSEETGEIIVDEQKCDGCGLCIPVCGFNAIALDPTKGIVVIL